MAQQQLNGAHVGPYHLKPGEAAQKVHDLDEGRRRYVRRYFRADIEDSLNYHLTINTALTGFQKTARIIANLVVDRLTKNGY